MILSDRRLLFPQQRNEKKEKKIRTIRERINHPNNSGFYTLVIINALI